MVEKQRVPKFVKIRCHNSKDAELLWVQVYQQQGSYLIGKIDNNPLSKTLKYGRQSIKYRGHIKVNIKDVRNVLWK